jgi:AraC-like DNA-binding protein
MQSLQQIIASSLDYTLTWCVHGWQEPFTCDWRIDPCFVIIHLPNSPCRLAIRRKDRVEEYHGRPGETFLLPAGTVHRFESPGCLTTGINIQYTLFSSVDILDLYVVPGRVATGSAVEIARDIEEIVETSGEIPEPGAGRANDDLDFVRIAHERELAFRLLTRVLRLSEMRPRGRERLLVLQTLKESLRHLEENLERKVSVATLAEIAGLSTHRFSALFREVIGHAPHQYILRRRVERAMMILTRSDASVVEIAAQLGFHDQPHFTRLFRTVTGVSPTYYRKNFQRRLVHT